MEKIMKKAQKWNMFLVVDLTLENKSAEGKAISSLLRMYLKDATDQKYDVDLMASVASGGTSLVGEIALSEKIRGQVGFLSARRCSGINVCI